MRFDSTNKIVRLCVQGMEQERLNNRVAAKAFYENAWTNAVSLTKKYIVAHNLARRQVIPLEKLYWNQQVLNIAIGAEEEEAKESLSSLYLNLAKDHEDMGDPEKVNELYQKALSYLTNLPADGYGQLIEGGIRMGLRRTDLNNCKN